MASPPEKKSGSIRHSSRDAALLLQPDSTLSQMPKEHGDVFQLLACVLLGLVDQREFEALDNGLLRCGDPAAAQPRWRFPRNTNEFSRSVPADLTAFRARLPAEDQARADAQLDAIRQMERRLQALAKGGSCSKPTIDAAVDYSTEASLPAAMRAFISLTVAALACDQTRIVVMHDFISDGSERNPRFGAPFPPVNTPGNGQHALSHNADNSTPQFEGFRRLKAFNTQLACELASKLKAIPEPGVDGQTMLDNTSSKACRHSAPYVDRRHRIHLVIKEG